MNMEPDNDNDHQLQDQALKVEVPIKPIVSLAGPNAIGAGLAAIRLLEALDPNFLHHRLFSTVPGGLRLPEAGTDLIVSAVDAGLPAEFGMDDVRDLVDVTGRTAIVLRDAPLGPRFSVVTAPPLPIITLPSLLLWWDIFEPAFRLVTNRPGPDRPWSETTCVQLFRGRLPVIGRPPKVGPACEVGGFARAAKIFNGWRAAVAGGAF